MTTTEQNEKFIIPIGPQHPALKEPGHFEFTVDGEIITSASARLGYVHRGIEKLAENRSWVQVLYLVERVCGICSHIHALAFAQGAETMAGVEIPPRAKAIRTIFNELERIHSHMLWLGVGAHEGGFDTLFMYSWRDRETVMDLLENLSGNRVNYSANVLGGVKFDIDESKTEEILKGIEFLEKRLEYYLEVVTTDESFLLRSRDIGTMTREQAEQLGATGPTARASNLARDIRVDAPYGGYTDFPTTCITDERCDLVARFAVRIKETVESCRLVREVLNNLPEGEIKTKFPRKVPEGEYISRVEAPRGELFYYMRSTGGTSPDRIKVRTPSLCNWGAVLALAIGHKLADVPMLLAGIDPCFSCNDRMVQISTPSQSNAQVWSWDKLRKYGIEYYK